jgi:hypothetical protein
MNGFLGLAKSQHHESRAGSTSIGENSGSTERWPDVGYAPDHDVAALRKIG